MKSEVQILSPRFSFFPIAAVLLLAILARPASAAEVLGPPGMAGPSKVNLRSGPGITFESQGALTSGDQVTILERSGQWTKVRAADGRTGYVFDEYLKRAAVEAAAPPETGAPTPPPPELAQVPNAPAENDPVADELARLRSEVEELKYQLEARTPSATAGDPPPLPTAAEAAAEGGPPTDPSMRLLSIAIVSLAIGWILGSTFSRRRSRNQRNRLRF